MANMELITSVTVGSGGAASVTLPATGTIPQTYTDLKVIASVRGTAAVGLGSNSLLLKLNAITTGYTSKWLYGSGSSPGSTSGGPDSVGTMNFANDTASTFNSAEIYLPNYTSSNAKSYSVDSVTENNSATVNELDLLAKLNSTTSPITNITLTPETGNFAEGSTFYLYGISNVTSTTKATGGIVSSDGTYNYHMFPFSGTFTPTTAISADVLVIAGGGGANAGGGGAGGVLYSTSQSLSTAQTITIGAGGVGGVGGYPVGPGNNGGNSSCGSLTATGGGGGGGYNASATLGAGNNGGSGGGAGTDGVGGTANAGTGTAGQGNNGGVSTFGTTAPYSGAGGGGAGGVGGTTVAADKAGLGGIGTVTFASWANATQTGVNNGYYAGGGGGGSYGVYSGSTPGTGGLGGGGTGSAGGTGTNGLTNTGSGGGGGNASTGASGGSGLVIIRYAI
jgi:hypothetical protein